MSGWVSPTGWNINLASPGPIGNTTPSSGSFTTLAASNTVTLSGGTANGVVYLDGSKAITSGSALFFDGNNFGIGTNSPNTKLQVNGVSESAVSISTNGTRQGAIYTDGSLTVINAYQGNPLVISVASSGVGYSEKVRIDSSGNFYLGVTPSAWSTSGNIEINGSIATGGYTVAGLPSGVPTGSRAYVTDALTPTSLTAVVGGGAVVVPVFYNGSAWIVG